MLGRQWLATLTWLPLPPQELPGLPQTMQEVLVVVGGRALEEDEEGGEEPSPHTGNFAFYNTKASKYLPCLSWA